MQSLCHFSSGVLNTQIPLGSLDFSTIHSSLKMTPSKSSFILFLYSLVQASLLIACSSFRSALFMALHFLMLTDAKALLMVFTEAYGATSLCNSDKGRWHAFLDSWTRWRWVLVSNFFWSPSH